jgi:hypothetical protein
MSVKDFDLRVKWNKQWIKPQWLAGGVFDGDNRLVGPQGLRPSVLRQCMNLKGNFGDNACTKRLFKPLKGKLDDLEGGTGGNRSKRESFSIV